MNINKLIFLISIIFTSLVFCAEQKERIDTDLKLNRQLIKAAQNGNQDRVQKLLAQGADVNARENNFGSTALIYAACNGHTQIVELLLNKGADVNAENLADNTALMLAARYDHTQIVNLINSYQNEYLPHLTQNSREYEYQTLSDIADKTGSPIDLAKLINEYAKLTFSEFLKGKDSEKVII